MIVIFILIGLILQISLLDAVSFFGIKPDILFILAILLNLYFPSRKGLISGFACGLLKDIFSAGPFGLNITTFLICILLTRRMRQYFYEEDALVRISIIFVLSLVNSIVYCIFQSVIFGVNFIAFFLLILILESIYTALISPLVFIPFKKCVLKSYI